MSKHMMGIGEIGTDVVFIRKWRWTFTGYDSRGNELMNNFVKVTYRPADSHIPPNFTQFKIFHLMYDSSEEARKAINETLYAVPRIVSARLAIWDGCGYEMDRWDLDAAQAKIIERDIQGDWDEEVMTIQVEYGDAYYSSNLPCR